MISVVRNCRRGAPIVTSVVADGAGRPVAVRKSSTHARGMAALRREHRGYGWYNSARPRLAVRHEEVAPTYAVLELEYVPGRAGNAAAGLSANLADVGAVVEHCAALWRGADRDDGPAHGDLSLDNVIFCEHEVVLIDWEHYCPAGFPAGFDLLYLVAECAWFESGHDPARQRRVAPLLRSQIDALEQRGLLHASLRATPLTSLARHLEALRTRLGEEAPPPDKLPVLLWSEAARRALDALLAPG
jgi:hypothetical protein